MKEGYKIVCINKDLNYFTYGKTYDVSYCQKNNRISSINWINVINDINRLASFFFKEIDDDDYIYEENFIGLDQWREIQIDKL